MCMKLPPASHRFHKAGAPPLRSPVHALPARKLQPHRGSSWSSKRRQPPPPNSRQETSSIAQVSFYFAKYIPFVASISGDSYRDGHFGNPILSLDFYIVDDDETIRTWRTISPRPCGRPISTSTNAPPRPRSSRRSSPSLPTGVCTRKLLASSPRRSTIQSLNDLGEYWVVNQVLAKQLHSTSEEVLAYTTKLMDKLEQACCPPSGCLRDSKG